MKYANWNVPERGAETPRALLAAGCTPLLAAILHLRGLSDPAAARSFLRGGAETLTNPLELTGMVDAVPPAREAYPQLPTWQDQQNALFRCS